MTFTHKFLCTTLFAIAALTGCGGGGGSSSPVAAATTAPLIAGAIVNLQDSAGGQVYFAFVGVGTLSTTTLTPITTAVVKINGVPLVLDATVVGEEGYVAVVAPDAAGAFNLSVTANGTVYTASDSAVTATFPVVSVPSPFRANLANTVTWTAPSGAPANMGYQFDITAVSKDVRVPAAGSLTPGMPLPVSNNSVPVLFSSNPLTTTSVTVPASTLVANTIYEPTLVAVWPTLVPIANAATGSVLIKSTVVNAASFKAQ
jgi:hypothetical protein